MGRRKRLTVYVVALIDALTYGIVLTLVAVLGAFVLSVATGGGAARANILLFVTGWVLMGYATFLLWPTRREDDTETDSYGPALASEHQTPFQAFTRLFPPIRWIELPPPEDRVPVRVQLFLSSILVFITSFLIEVVWNVG